jgi:Reverse transcriptase (RNA-dependent DNA polymerase)
VKRDEKGQVSKYKIRLVAKGFLQKFGENCTEVFAPTSNLTSVRLLLSYAAQEKLDVQQIDVKTAFFNGEITDEVYIKQPPDFEVPGKVWKLKRAIYVLKQAALAWYERLKKAFLGMDFKSSDADPCLYWKDVNGSPAFLIVHVDDCILIGTSECLRNVKQSISDLFEVSDIGSIKFFLGIELIRDVDAGRIWIGQRQYAKNVLARFGMSDCKPRVAPLDANMQLCKSGKPLGLDMPYRELVGSLLYLSTCTRPDLAHSVGMLSRFVSAPTEEHWAAAKQVLRYIAGTIELGIVYGGATGEPIGYSDSIFAVELEGRKSTSCNVFLFGGGAISWSSKLQTVVATSTCEAELIAFAAAVKEALQQSKILVDVFGRWTPVLVYGDNDNGRNYLDSESRGWSSQPHKTYRCLISFRQVSSDDRRCASGVCANR